MHRVQPLSSPHASDLNGGGDPCLFTFCAAEPLPQVELTQPLIRRFIRAKSYKRAVFFMRSHFDKLATIYRLAGVPSFIALFFVENSIIRTVLSLSVVACSSSIVSTGLFVSADVLAVLARNYEFWFLVVINAFNWTVLAFIFNDIRALACMTSWFGLQTVIFMDANYRTYPNTVYSTTVSTPVVLIIAGLVAARWIAGANYFDIHVNSKVVGNAADLIGFSTTTLVVFLVKILVHRKSRVKQQKTQLTIIPCVIIRSTLRLTPLISSTATQPQHASLDHHRLKQDLLLSSLPLDHIDVRRTILPSRLWQQPPQWIQMHADAVRRVFYLIGAVALVLLLVDTFESFHETFQVAHAGGLTHGNDVPTYRRHALAVTTASSALTLFFCGTFALFYQRDLLRLLLRNFDFVFSALQTFVFVVCLCDMDRWNLRRCMMVTTWWIWFLWVLCLDALTQPVNDRVFRLRKQWTAPIIAGMIFSSGSVGLMMVLMPEFGLRNRMIWHHKFSSTGVEFTVQTRAILLGRAITICLWCSRQAFLRMTRRDDELLLIRGNVEYASGYATFTWRSRRRITIASMSSTVIPIPLTSRRLSTGLMIPIGRSTHL